MVKKYSKSKKARHRPSGVERGRHIQGDGFTDFLKKSKIISRIGKYVLPAAGATLGAAAGTFEAPVVGTVEGGIVGASAGEGVNAWIESMGYGPRGAMGKPTIRKREQFATGKRGGVKKKGSGIARSGAGIRRSGGTIGRGKKFDKLMEYSAPISPYAGLYTARRKQMKKGKGKCGGSIGRGINRSGGSIGRGYSSHGKVHQRTSFAT